jgi:hypothetical protein
MIDPMQNYGATALFQFKYVARCSSWNNHSLFGIGGQGHGGIIPPNLMQVKLSQTKKQFQSVRRTIVTGPLPVLKMTMPIIISWVRPCYQVWCGNNRWRHKYILDISASRLENDRAVTNRIRNILRAVEMMHRCKATHEASQVVMEQFRGQTVWDGVVEVFQLSSHPQAKRCYAWSLLDKGEPRYVTVLELPPVNSACTAVQAAIASGQQE